MRNSSCTSVLEIDKENRLPGAMAQAGKQAAHMTPGKRSKKGTNNQYFEVGKVGRKTGITLRDTGIRDEHGLEPVSGIFSSPVLDNDELGSVLVGAEEDEADGDDTVPGIGATSSSRRTPRFPPARASTPKHTNIGSPKRMSSARPATRQLGSEDELSPAQSKTQPPPNRQLDFTGKANKNRKSIVFTDAQSPFKPKKSLRRSVVPVHADRLENPGPPSDSNHAQSESPSREVVDMDVDVVVDDDGDAVEQSIENILNEDASLVLEDGRSEGADGEQTRMSMGQSPVIEAHTTFSRRSTGKSGSPSESIHKTRHTPPAAVMISAPSSSGKKRDRNSVEKDDGDGDVSVSVHQAGQSSKPFKRKRGMPSNDDQAVAGGSRGEETIDPSLLANVDEGTSQLPDDSAEIQEEIQPEVREEVPRRKGRPKGKDKAQRMPKERDPNRAMRKSQSPVVDSEEPTDSRLRRGGSSNVHLRATTPFEDADHRISRSGRALIKPLKYWENESVIWNKGTIEGIVRADPVVKPEPNRGRRKKGGRKRGARLEDIEEGSDNESIMPDEWETTHGVISGKVAKWNPATNTGDPDDPVEEDLAFAASSITTHDVAGADFKFAKILTIPFFGAGLVELPPEGFKRAKNSRKMQMLFFVHEGKVVVEVGAVGMEVNQFALSKGGCWSVPRGNNYAIVNESRTKSAKVFFAQGCEVSETVLAT